MSEIHIKLQRNKELHDWSLEINGRLHEHVSDEGLTDVVEGALIVAVKTLILTSDGGESLVDTLEHSASRSQMIIQMADPKMRHLDMADEDWDMAMEDLFDTLRKLPPGHKAQACDVVERCLFKGQSDA
jgi:hypothetical protein